MARRQSRNTGITLLELMVTLVIVAVLMSVALPAYNDSLRKGRRSDAIAGLLKVAARQEQHMLYRLRYSVDLRELGFSEDPLLSDQGYYLIQANLCEQVGVATCYLLSATPVPGASQALDTACASFLLDSLGQRAATGSRADNCW
jgi:type IV pilus assembly protein PilE